jgi:hypothetical protein
MSVETTRAVLEKYLDPGHDVGQVMSGDVVFTLMGTGEEHKGSAAIQQMLIYLYGVAFEARAELKTSSMVIQVPRPSSTSSGYILASLPVFRLPAKM